MTATGTHCWRVYDQLPVAAGEEAFVETVTVNLLLRPTTRVGPTLAAKNGK